MKMLIFAIVILNPTRRQASMQAARNAEAGIPSQPSKLMCRAALKAASKSLASRFFFVFAVEPAACFSMI